MLVKTAVRLWIKYLELELKMQVFKDQYYHMVDLRVK